MSNETEKPRGNIEVPNTSNLGEHPMVDSLRRKIGGIVFNSLAIAGTFVATLYLGYLAVNELPMVLDGINHGDVGQIIYHGIRTAGSVFVAGASLLLTATFSYWAIFNPYSRR